MFTPQIVLRKQLIDVRKVISDGKIRPWKTNNGDQMATSRLEISSDHFNFSPTVSYSSKLNEHLDLKEEQKVLATIVIMFKSDGSYSFKLLDVSSAKDKK